MQVNLDQRYLHYSIEELQWIRTGKVVGSDEIQNGLVDRSEKGHRKKAATASLDDGECFYSLLREQILRTNFQTKLDISRI